MSKIQLDEGTKVAYFPMMDHNPGPLHLLFSFVLDVCTYMAVEPNGIVAIHCKAGKGRTGLAVGCYLMFMEAC
jgi:phosphatidylinositol-3,4,5-trisphosphate 3-phosphatase/dual-specificity protein phosphatase PTEN